jgi:hypothetical protein
LDFIGVRGSIPVAEEKMLLDGVKMVLDNGWTIQDEEMLQLFDMCKLKTKVFFSLEYSKFLEFVYVVVAQLGLEQEKIQSYFRVKF